MGPVMFVMPWWVVCSLLLFGLIIFSWYIEGVAFAFLLDLLYTPLWSTGYRWLFVWSVVAIFLVELVLKPIIRYEYA